MSEGIVKQVKVDNWGIFFLQRLQQLFVKSEHCDLVLQFSTNEKIKVHRLVLNACTEYFQFLEKQGHINGDALQMPAEFQPDVVIPIINFMYTGKLEFRSDLLKRLYVAAQQMNMSVLTKLLDAQNAASATPIKPILKKTPQIPITYNLQGRKIAPKQIDPDLPETLPGRKLPIWKRRNVPANIPSYYDESPSYGLYESKMPPPIIDESPRPTRFEWPDENLETSPYSSSFDDLSYETKPIVKPVTYPCNKQPVPKSETPQRVATFEEVCRTATNMKRIQSSPIPDIVASKKVKLDLQAVKEYVQEHRLRKVLLDTAEENGEEVDDDLAVADLDDDDDMDEEDAYEEMQEHSSLQHTNVQHESEEMQLVELQDQNKVHAHAELTATVQEESMSNDQQPPSQPVPVTLISIEPATQQSPPQVQAAPSQQPSPLTQQPVTHQAVLPPQKSILKAQGSHEESVPSAPVNVSSKKVRFLLDAKSPEGKENTATTPSTPKFRRTDESQRPLPTRADNITTIGGAVANTGNLSNHAKIITEVLKKYPNLVKNNKNIRLKIMQRGGGAQVAPALPVDGDANKTVKSKVSYVVLKSDVAGVKGKPAVVLKHGGHVEPLSELVGQKPASGAENITGPWLCHSCGSNEEPIHFDTYYLYRRHLQDVHMEKIDARICEHCGHRASKRNLLLYHLYTRHGVPPPRNCQFPRCDQCDYVALSESLLIKHRNNHINNKEFICKVCGATFKSNGALQGHMQTNLHSDPARKLYECPFCQKPFVRNINLKAHIRTSHKEVINKIDEEGRLQMSDGKEFGGLNQFEDGEEAHSSDTVGEENLTAEGEEGEMMDVPVIDAVMQKPGTGTVILPSGVTVLAEAPAVQSLVPSSEAEALSNVASGIAASLGLADTLTGEQTVIVLDENQEFVLHSTEIVGEETTTTDEKGDEVSLGTGDMQEYIVPDMMPEDSQDQQQNPAYTGPLADLEHYPGVGHSSVTVTASQTATAPPPVSVAVSVVGGDEVTMVLTDHDYAPIRNSNGEGVMFFITSPADVDANDVKCTVAAPQPQLPQLEEKELGPPQLTAETSLPVQEVKFNNTPPVLTREAGSVEIEQRLDDVTGKDSVHVSEDQQKQEQITEVITIQEQSTMELPQEVAAEEVEILADQSNEEIQRINETPALEESQVQDVENEERVEEEECTEVILDSPVSQPVAHSTPIRRQPPVQMADIMKEWDDFDDEDNENCSVLQQSQQTSSESEPKFFRGPLSDEQ